MKTQDAGVGAVAPLVGVPLTMHPLPPAAWLRIAAEATRQPTPAEQALWLLVEPLVQAVETWDGLPMPDDPAVRRELIATWEVRAAVQARCRLAALSEAHIDREDRHVR